MNEQLSAGDEETRQLKKEIELAKQQLADCRQYNDALTATIRTPTLVLNEQLMVTSGNKAFYQKFAATEKEVIGHAFNSLAPCPWQSPGLVEQLKWAIEAASHFNDFELTAVFPGDKKYILLFSARYFQNSANSPLLLVSIIDITNERNERTRFMKNKHLLEERITLAVEAAEMGTWEMDPETDLIIWDQRCQELFGILKERVTYEEFLGALHPDDRLPTDTIVQKVQQGYKNGKYNTIYRTQYQQDSNTKWLKASGRVYFDPAGKAVRFAGTVMDYTQQQQNEQLLSESEARFRLAADAAAVMIWLTDINNQFNYFNKSWLQFTGNEIEKEIGLGWKKGIYSPDMEHCEAVYTASFIERKAFTVEFRLLRNDGTYRWLANSGVPRFSPAGIFEGFVGTCIDIHDQKMTRDELEKLVKERTKLLIEAIQNLEASNQNLEEFAYVASHDLQEPLRKIQTFANRLREKSASHLNDETQLYISKITAAATRMGGLINDLLNYSRLQKKELQFEKVNLNDIINEVLSDYDLVIQEKNAVIEVDELPVISAIPLRMHQLFQNLVSNALKFARPGVPPIIKICTDSPGEDILRNMPGLPSNKPLALITLEDNGIGFDEVYAEKIFQVFQRLNGANEYEGTGIGLAICRKIVTNHQGVIVAESQEGKGTKFSILLPL